MDEAVQAAVQAATDSARVQLPAHQQIQTTSEELSLQQRQLLPESYVQLYHLNFGGFADEVLIAKSINDGEKTKMLQPILTAIKDYQNEDD